MAHVLVWQYLQGSCGWVAAFAVFLSSSLLAPTFQNVEIPINTSVPLTLVSNEFLSQFAPSLVTGTFSKGKTTIEVFFANPQCSIFLCFTLFSFPSGSPSKTESKSHGTTTPDLSEFENEPEISPVRAVIDGK